MAMPKNRMRANIKKKQYYKLVREAPGELTKTARHLFPLANRQMHTPIKMPTRPANPRPRPRTTRSYPIATKNACYVRMPASESAMMKIAYTKHVKEQNRRHTRSPSPDNKRSILKQHFLFPKPIIVFK